ncbi:vesicle-trafficking protein SEC22a-like isoform X1 [Ostrea edulis]|uniref:vesicle-trafficking protein SEC22a-like isoform X1 n=1 Tax=Ostrea edulis TaxID=37623 RepID=UPI002095FC6E|nr:vesicle-trafficking protein SEC22a-like isoform X1 [Ostrea edulis]XP_048754229.1 vesicle-trafficking protein SEC22a-like isoform X1 [Ostrea edulis]XP_056008290.1 vesicle-trafficking protein SEC22a-like isoform X1 [Ostrea edulis]
MSVHNILISRTSDGLLLTANTDARTCSDPEELKKSFNQAKLLARISSRIPDRATYVIDQFTIHMISALNLTYLVICDSNYPSVLAFTFLDDVQREFLQSNERERVESVTRPYALIQFDTALQRIKQRYNSTRSMASKLNLSQLQEEIKLRPPHMITPEELRPGGGANVNSTDSQTHFTLAIPKRYGNYLPINLLVVVSICLNSLCAVLNFTRGVAVINEAHIEDFARDHYQNAASFIFCSFLLLFQVYLMCYPRKQRKPLACATLGSVCLCQLYLWELRNNVQIFFHVTVACYGTFVIFTRPVQEKLPQYTL